MIASILALLATALLGAPFARLADRDAPLLRFFGEALLFGTGLAATTLMLLGLTGVPWSMATLLAGVLVLAILGFALAHARRVWTFTQSTHDRRAIFFDAVTLITLAGYSRFATAAPMWELDFIDNWGLKGRMFWHARGFDWTFLTNPHYRWSHQDYPPLVPLVFDFISLGVGHWEDRWVGIYYVGVAAALLAMIRSLLTEEIGPLRAAAATLALTCVIASPWPGLADGPLVAYGTAGALLLRRAVQHRSNTLFNGAAVLLGFAALTKNEGISLTVAAAVALLVTTGWRSALRLWPAALLAAPWMMARARFDLATDLTSGSFVDRALDHLREPGVYLAHLARYSPGQPLLWLGIGIGLVLGIRSALPRERLLLLISATQLLFYLGAYVVTPLDVEFHIRWSWDRLVWHVMPMLALVSLVTASRFAWPAAGASQSPSTSTAEPG